MSLKQELLQWDEAVKAYEAGDYEGALELFNPIADSSKIHFNIGMVLQTLGQHENAAMAFGDAVQCDNYLSVAYFQQGVSLYILQDFEGAIDAFDNSHLYFRGTNMIDYSQLGLDYKLYACEVLYNRALTFFQIGDEDAAMQDLTNASKSKEIPEHDIINEAIQYRGDGCQLFQVPANLTYRPPKQKLANAAKVDYLGRSKVVAATDPSDNFTEFKGARGIQPDKEANFAPVRSMDRKSSISNVREGMQRRPSAPMPMSPSLGRNGGDAGPPRTLERSRSNTVGSMSRRPSTPMSSGGGRGPPLPPLINRQSPPTVPRSPYPESDYGTISSRVSMSRASIASGKLRVKVNFGDKRMLMLPADATFDELLDKIVEKFGTSKFRVMFPDEDGELVSMTDDDDFLLCRSISPDENKIEIWCE